MKPVQGPWSLAAALLTSSCLVLSGPAGAADDFYKDKTISVVVGFTPGGGYDAYGRQLARFLPEHIPGKPNVIVQNMPGAGSMTAVRALDATQPKDGTVIVIFNPGLIVQSVVQPEKAPVDFHKYVFVGTVTPDFRVCYGFGPNGVKSWEDMMSRKEFILGATGKGSGNYVNGATMREVFNAPVKQILGFPGSNEQRLAVERGELELYGWVYDIASGHVKGLDASGRNFVSLGGEEKGSPDERHVLTSVENDEEFWERL